MDNILGFLVSPKIMIFNLLLKNCSLIDFYSTENV
jgi:hypothetical protein